MKDTSSEMNFWLTGKRDLYISSPSLVVSSMVLAYLHLSKHCQQNASSIHRPVLSLADTGPPTLDVMAE